MDIGQLTWRHDSPSLVLCEKSLQPQTGNRSSQADGLVKRADVDALDESEYICSNDSLFTFQTVSVYKMVLVLHVRLFRNSFLHLPILFYRILLYFYSILYLYQWRSRMNFHAVVYMIVYLNMNIVSYAYLTWASSISSRPSTLRNPFRHLILLFFLYTSEEQSSFID